MIFFFSGTGNSRWVAETVAREFNETLVYIPDALRKGEYSYTLQQDEKLGFIFPCYAWGVPVFISEFISKLQISHVDYLYYIATCGDDTGLLRQEFTRLVESKGWECNLAYEIMMPESYVNLPGFDVDPKDKEQRKIVGARQKLQSAIGDITDRRHGCFHTLPGIFPWTKSIVLGGVFHRWLMTPKYFHTNGQCIGCGECVEQCPMHNIKLTDGRPEWGTACVICMRCYHSCVAHAIEWGRFTKHKGQYLYKSKL